MSEATNIPYDQTRADDALEQPGPDDRAVNASPEVENVTDPVGAGETSWSGGGYLPYEVGDPGRAAREVVAGVSENPADPADTQLDAGETAQLVVRAASVRGTSHRHNGTPRQDDYSICTTNDWLVIVVADGVSAGALSHQAATIACRAAATFLREALDRGVGIEQVDWTEMLNEAARRIVVHGRRALSSDDRPHEDVTAEDVARAMATTLVVVAVPAESAETRTMTGIAFGDTSVFVLDRDGAWRAVTSIKNDGAEIASSATIALPFVPADTVVPFGVELGQSEAVFVMTDGVGDPLGRGDGPVGEFLAEVWKSPPDMLSFGGQVGFARRSFDDDRTVVGVWVRE